MLPPSVRPCRVHNEGIAFDARYFAGLVSKYAFVNEQGVFFFE